MAKPDPHVPGLDCEDAQVVGVACMILAMESAGGAVRFLPVTSVDRGCVYAAVSVCVGTSALPFALEDCALAAEALRLDPPFDHALDLANRLDAACDTARDMARRLI